MLKTLTNKEKRKQLQEYIEVVFAAATIATFVVNRIKKDKDDE